MNAEKEYFIHLLSCFLNGNTPKTADVDWNEIYKLAEIHNLCGIICQQIKYLPKENQPKDELKSYFNQQLGFAIRLDEKRDSAKQIVDSFLNKNGIDHIFVKGVEIKSYYPVPELRTSGDIDVILRRDEFESTYKLLKESNIKITNYATNVITAMVNGIEIEFHSNADVITDYFDDIFNLSCVKYEHTYILTEYEHLLYIICHLCKHLAYRGAGIRMLMDIDALVRGIESFDYKRLMLMADKAGIKQSTSVLLSLCKKWFNTPVESSAEINDRLIECFDRVMLDGGSFGYEINSIPIKHIGSNKLSTLIKLAFPSRELLKSAYPYYNKNKFLLPVARINRLTDAVFRKRRRAVASAKQIYINGGNANIQQQLLTELGIGD